ncbi:MAG: YraN family protein [Gammaproteobacteria bacterium]|nr:YraN family protein [Gammaproteobacteria bacterium]
MPNSVEQGQNTETMALEYLQQQGLSLLERNFRCKMGEIDLIMTDNADGLLFVEVRYRKNNLFGGAAASVTLKKQQKLIRTAQLYLQMKKLSGRCYSRFDVVALSGAKMPYQIEWIKDAFQAY